MTNTIDYYSQNTKQIIEPITESYTTRSHSTIGSKSRIPMMNPNEQIAAFLICFSQKKCINEYSNIRENPDEF